jgi:hypothetical protein
MVYTSYTTDFSGRILCFVRRVGSIECASNHCAEEAVLSSPLFPAKLQKSFAPPV